MRDWEWCDTSGFLSRKPSLQKTWFLNNIYAISNPLGVNRGEFISKGPKSLYFKRFFNWNCMKISVEIAWLLEPTHWLLEQLGSLSDPKHLSTPSSLSGPTQFKNPLLSHFKLKKKNKKTKKKPDPLNTSTNPNASQAKHF